jgi:hypothetical protein
MLLDRATCRTTPTRLLLEYRVGLALFSTLRDRPDPARRLLSAQSATHTRTVSVHAPTRSPEGQVLELEHHGCNGTRWPTEMEDIIVAYSPGWAVPGHMTQGIPRQLCMPRRPAAAEGCSVANKRRAGMSMVLGNYRVCRDPLEPRPGYCTTCCRCFTNSD